MGHGSRSYHDLDGDDDPSQLLLLHGHGHLHYDDSCSDCFHCSSYAEKWYHYNSVLPVIHCYDGSSCWCYVAI